MVSLLVAVAEPWADKEYHSAAAPRASSSLAVPARPVAAAEGELLQGGRQWLEYLWAIDQLPVRGVEDVCDGMMLDLNWWWGNG